MTMHTAAVKFDLAPAPLPVPAAHLRGSAGSTPACLRRAPGRGRRGESRLNLLQSIEATEPEVLTGPRYAEDDEGGGGQAPPRWRRPRRRRRTGWRRG